MDITSLEVPEEDANRVRQMQMAAIEWDEEGEEALRKGYKKGKRSEFMGKCATLLGQPFGCFLVRACVVRACCTSASVLHCLFDPIHCAVISYRCLVAHQWIASARAVLVDYALCL